MDSQPPPKASSAFEYFLYAAILVETGLAALIYKVLFRGDDLAHLRVYLAIFYFGFLAWAIAQLNRLHRNRKFMADHPAPVEEAAPREARAGLGLSSEQLITIVLVFAAAVAAFSWLLRQIG